MMTALFIDDSGFMRELLKVLVNKHNVEAAGDADNGKTGVEKYKELKPDLVFLDIMMDEMDGIEALRQIKDFDPDARVIMVSSMMHQDPFVEDAIALGAKAVINKPFDSREIADVLQKIQATV